MRTAVLADIHANMAALEAVLEDIRDEMISDIITLGDNIGYGPDPEEVIQELIKHDIISIQGNHEYALINPNYYLRMNPDPKKIPGYNQKNAFRGRSGLCRRTSAAGYLLRRPD